MLTDEEAIIKANSRDWSNSYREAGTVRKKKEKVFRINRPDNTQSNKAKYKRIPVCIDELSFEECSIRYAEALERIEVYDRLPESVQKNMDESIKSTAKYISALKIRMTRIATPDQFNLLECAERMRVELIKIRNLNKELTAKYDGVRFRAENSSDFNIELTRRHYEALHGSAVLFEKIEYVEALKAYMAKKDFINSLIVSSTVSQFNFGWKVWQSLCNGARLWVSVLDEPPPIGEAVLVAWSDSPDVEPEKDFMDICIDTGVAYWANYENDPPSHWMNIIALGDKQVNE